MLTNVVVTELMKLKRAKIVWLSFVAYSFGPLAAGLFMWIVMEPGRAERMGLLGQKAQVLSMVADWPSYLGLLLQITGIGGMILVSVIGAYVFGREHAENMAKNMLALPIDRGWFVGAKFLVILVWFVGLSLWLLLEGLMVGSALGLTGFSWDVYFSGALEVLGASLVAFLLTPVVAWVAVWQRGYLAPLGFTFFALIVGNVMGATGWGRWFPWSIAPLYAGVAGPREGVLAAGSLSLLFATFVAGVGGTLWVYYRGDHLG